MEQKLKREYKKFRCPILNKKFSKCTVYEYYIKEAQLINFFYTTSHFLNEG